MLTQAARKRSALERARKFSTKGDKVESQEARDRRIKEMKSRMPCSACKAHEKTVFGRWHGDRECPHYIPKESRACRDKTVMAVETGDLSDTEDDLMLEESVVCLSTVVHFKDPRMFAENEVSHCALDIAKDQMMPEESERHCG